MVTPKLDRLGPRHCPATAVYAAGVLTLPAGGQVQALSGFPGPGDVATDGENTVVGAGAGGGPVVQVFAADGRMTASFYAFDESFRGGVQVGIDAAGIRVVPAPGSGGGPVLRTFAADGGLLSSVWVGDPANRDGVFLAAGERAAPVPAPVVVQGVPSDLSRLGVRLVAGPDPTADQWQALRADLSRLSPALVRDLIASGVAVDVVTDGITNHPAIPAGFGADVGGAFAGGFAAVVALGGESGSVSTVLHEVGHGADARLLGGVSQTPGWVAFHATVPWANQYERDRPGEAFAESFARHVRGLPQPDQWVAAYFSTLFAARGW